MIKFWLPITYLLAKYSVPTEEQWIGLFGNHQAHRSVRYFPEWGERGKATWDQGVWLFKGAAWHDCHRRGTSCSKKRGCKGTGLSLNVAEPLSHLLLNFVLLLFYIHKFIATSVFTNVSFHPWQTLKKSILSSPDHNPDCLEEPNLILSCIKKTRVREDWAKKT